MSRVARVTTSIEFREAVMDLQRDGLQAFVRLEGKEAPVYRVMPLGASSQMTVVDLFGDHVRPVHMEDVAQAMIFADRKGSPVTLVVYSD